MSNNELADRLEDEIKEWNVPDTNGIVQEAEFVNVLRQSVQALRDAQNTREGALSLLDSMQGILGKFTGMTYKDPHWSRRANECQDAISALRALLTEPAQAETVKSLRCPACGESFDRWMDAGPSKANSEGETPRTDAYILPATEKNYERLLTSHGELERELNAALQSAKAKVEE